MASKNPEKPQKRLPPGQAPIKQLLRWGIDHPGISRGNPKIDLKAYTLTIDGEVEKALRLSWSDVLELPKAESVSDFHCVEGWSVLDCKWEGIRFKQIVALARPKENVKSVTFECADGYTTSLTLEELSGDDVLLAYGLNRKPLEEGFGFPLRLVVPSKYGYKSALWVTHIKFTAEKELGYWEKRGYSDTADVWSNDRFAS
jgi:DMSO/TMAO reductase YedYZ molybdopterin-dependent catalytic subunit